MRKLLSGFGRNEDGATAIEYALIASLLSVAIIGALLALNGSITSMFNRITVAITSVL